MWPYWLDGRAPSTVRNSFQLGSMALLTGAPSLTSNNYIGVLQVYHLAARPIQPCSS